jgi:hypothetical protein
MYVDGLWRCRCKGGKSDTGAGRSNCPIKNCSERQRRLTISPASQVWLTLRSWRDSAHHHERVPASGHPGDDNGSATGCEKLPGLQGAHRVTGWLSPSPHGTTQYDTTQHGKTWPGAICCSAKYDGSDTMVRTCPSTLLCPARPRMPPSPGRTFCSKAHNAYP